MTAVKIPVLVSTGTKAGAAAKNRILKMGEWGFESDEFGLKIGRGLPWNQTPYLFDSGNSLIGPLASLQTTNRNTIVAAINELVANKADKSEITDYLTRITNAESAIGTLSGNLNTVQGTLQTQVTKIYNAEQAVLALQQIANGNDVNLNTIAQIQTYIKNNRASIEGFATGKLNASAVYNALDRVEVGKVLDARQGKVLKGLIDGLNATIAALRTEFEALREHVLAGTPLSQGIWIEHPTIAEPALNGSGTAQVNVSAGTADWPDGLVTYEQGIFYVPVPGAGLQRIDGIAALADGTYVYVQGAPSANPRPNPIPTGSLLVNIILMSENGGIVTPPTPIGAPTPTVGEAGSATLNFHNVAGIWRDPLTQNGALPFVLGAGPHKIGSFIHQPVQVTTPGPVTFDANFEEYQQFIGFEPGASLPVGKHVFMFSFTPDGVSVSVPGYAGENTGGGTGYGGASLEAASAILKFDNPFGHIRTDALTGTQTFTKTGSTIGSAIMQAYTATGTGALIFDFPHTILGSDFTSGAILASGSYELYFLNKGASVSINIAKVGATVAPPVEPLPDTTPPSAPQNLVFSNITTSGYTATANSSTDN